MRTIGSRLAAASATLLALLGLSVGTAHGDRLVETVYGEPVTYYAPTGYVTTSRVVGARDVYLAPASYAYVAPTSYSYSTTGASYVLPASYATTAYTYLPTSYAYTPTYYTTSYYRRPGLLRRLASRPVIETTYRYGSDVYPTTVYQPTTISYDPGLVTTSLSYMNPCGETSAPFNPPTAAEDATATAKIIRSQPKDTSDEQVYDDAATKKAAADAAAKTKAKDPGGSPLDPPAVAPEKDPVDPGGLAPGNAPPPKGPGDSVDRTSFRKNMKDVQPRPAGATSSQGMLRGEVVSGVNRDPKPNLQVVFTDLRNRYPDRIKTTDAKGTFEVFLPDGGWSYRVVDPAAPAGAKPKEYDGQVIATSGRYLDETDAPLYGLRLNY